MSKVFGVAVVKFNGIDYRTKPGWEFETGGVNRTSQYASGKRSGTSDEPMGSKASGAIEIMSDTDLETLRNFDGGIVEYVTNVGMTYSAPNSSVMNGLKLQDNGRGASLEIEGDEATLVKG
jgi:hypothetical protein